MKRAMFQSKNTHQKHFNPFSTSVGLTPPPGLFHPSGFATPLTPAGASTPAAPLAPALHGPLTVMPQRLGWKGHETRWKTL